MSQGTKKTFKLPVFAKERLQSILDSSDMTQAEIAKMTGLTQANISYMFNKKLDSISYSLLDILSEALEFNKDYILKEECISKQLSIDHELWLRCSSVIIDFVKKENIALSIDNISNLTASLHNHIVNKHFPIEEAHTYLYGQMDFWIKMRTIRKTNS